MVESKEIYILDEDIDEKRRIGFIKIEKKIDKNGSLRTTIILYLLTDEEKLIPVFLRDPGVGIFGECLWGDWGYLTSDGLFRYLWRTYYFNEDIENKINEKINEIVEKLKIAYENYKKKKELVGTDIIHLYL